MVGFGKMGGWGRVEDVKMGGLGVDGGFRGFGSPQN